MKKRVFAILLVCACGPQAGNGDGEESGADDDPSSTSTGAPTTDAPTTDMPSTDAPTTDTFTSSMEGDVETGVDEVTTIDGECIADLGVSSFECSLFLEDCPCDEKCMPYANDGGNAWNDLKCVPVDRDPKGVGEPCSVQGNGVSGIDDCGPHSMCFDVDPDTSMGTCVAFCDGSEADPSCADECSRCAINGDGVLALCLPLCDPLATNCGVGEVCAAYSADFTCVPATQDLGIGESCEFINDCAAGLFCASSDLVPSCESSSCCTSYCDTAIEDSCAGAPEGTTCQPWGEVPGCVTPTLGVCVVEP
jgi:hypothetical protein